MLANAAVRQAVLGRFVKYQDGIHYDATKSPQNGGRCYAKVPGGALTTGHLTDIFTFTGDNKSYYMGSAGLLVPSVTNTPRIEYDANGNLLGLLVEGARTNVLTQSQSGTITDWPTRSNVTGSSALSIAGVTTGLVYGDNSLQRYAYKTNYTYLGTTTYTLSIFVKMDDGGAPVIGGNVGGVDMSLLADGDTLTTVTATLFSGTTYRVTKTFTTAGSPTGTNNTGIIKQTAHTARTFTATGIQLEVGAFPSSYIPTTTGSVARAQDIATRTFGAEFSTSAGTTFAEFDMNAAVGSQAVLSRDSNGRPLYGAGPSATVRITDATNSPSGGNALAAGVNKASSAYGSDGLAISLNGAAVVTSVFDGSMGAAATLSLGATAVGSGSVLWGHIRRLSYWPEQRSNAFLQMITS